MYHISHRNRHSRGMLAAGAEHRVGVIVVFDGVKWLDAAGPAEASSLETTAD